MSERYMPAEDLVQGYTAILSSKDTQLAISQMKSYFEQALSAKLSLFKHVAPLAFPKDTGINDDLDGSQLKSAVSFHIPNLRGVSRGIKVDLSEIKETHPLDAEVVQSLAKWKRVMLLYHGCQSYEGLFCDSLSIRKGYFGDATHSSIVDQWDWERVIKREDRTREFLIETVNALWTIIKETEAMLVSKHPALERVPRLPDTIKIISSQDLFARYPGADVHGRENAGVREFGAIFIVGMGDPLPDGIPQELRAPDYDDWSLNGDIIVLHPLTGIRHELSSMGIRVDAESMRRQLDKRNMTVRASLPYHRAVLNDELPLCIGGGIGISRLAMLLLGKAHVGEVQIGVWHPQHIAEALAANIHLLPSNMSA